MGEHEGTPAASIVLPAFNAARTIGIQLRALTRQPEHARCEILVCDNASTDSTRAAVARWAQDHPNIRIVDASRARGPAAARNDGAREARSARLLFCDADDEVAPGWISAQIAALEVADVAVGGFFEPIRRPFFRASAPWSLDSRAPVYKGYFRHLPAGGSGNMAVRTDTFTAVGGFDESFRAGEDIDLCWRIQLDGGLLAYSSDAIVAYSPRIGLRSTYRQSATHRHGDELLRRRYAHLALTGPTRTDALAVGSGRAAPWTSAPRRHRLSPGRILGAIAWRLGQRSPQV